MKKTTIKVFIEKDPIMPTWNIISQTEGYPATEAHDDSFPEKEAAQEVAKQVREEIQEANPNKNVILTEGSN